MCIHQCSLKLSLSHTLVVVVATMFAFISYIQPNDWAYQRYEDQRKGTKRDYVTIDEGQLVLTLSWAAIVFGFIGRASYTFATGDSYWSFLPWMSS